ncbi:hypothetical protein ACGFIW_01440 [Micromonospora sp. NPDC048935]|uniref:hypothetical protein n=1 Tax=Micromonospora sp. NPDC048935 TaxID=3364262 RepID=UPI00371D9257
MTDPRPPGDRHRNKAMGIRPGDELQERTKKTLDANGWTMTEFVSACMELVNQNPAAMLKRLAAFKPTTARGRPPKKPG